MSGESERSVEKYLGRCVSERQGLCLKWISPGLVGVPDRIIILPGGHVLFVEVKTETGRLSPAQTACHRRMRMTGARVETVYGKVDVNKLMEDLI